MSSNTEFDLDEFYKELKINESLMAELAAFSATCEQFGVSEDFVYGKMHEAHKEKEGKGNAD